MNELISRPPTKPQCLVLAGGLGSRLKHVIGETPKVLAEIAGRPFIDHVINLLMRQGIQEIILSVGHLADKVQAYCGDGSRWGFRISYSVETEQLGTAGALRHALPMITGPQIFVLNGDTYLEADLPKMQRSHESHAAAATIAVVKACGSQDWGKVDVDSRWAVQAFVEKGEYRAEFANAGLYMINRDAIAAMPSRYPYSLEYDFLPHLLREGRTVLAYPVGGSFVDIGTPERYLAAQTLLRGGCLP